MSDTGRKRGMRIAMAVLVVLAGLATGAWLVPGHMWQSGHAPVTRVALPSTTHMPTPDGAMAQTDDAAVPDIREPDFAIATDTAGALPDPVAAAAEAAAAQAAGTMLPSTAAPSSRQTGSDDNMIPVAFDLNRPGGGAETVSGEAIVVRKAVRVNNREVGSLPIHVDAGSRLLVDPAELASVLSKAGMPRELRKPRGDKKLLSFSELRNDGIDLRYDPNSDSVLITTG